MYALISLLGITLLALLNSWLSMSGFKMRTLVRTKLSSLRLGVLAWSCASFTIACFAFDSHLALFTTPLTSFLVGMSLGTAIRPTV